MARRDSCAGRLRDSYADPFPESPAKNYIVPTGGNTSYERECMRCIGQGIPVSAGR